MMYRRILWAALVLFLVACLVAGLALYSVYRAAVAVPEFYERASRVDPQRQVAASDQMLQETAALVSEVEEEGKWDALFTEEQINGWLAVDLVRNHPDRLPPSIREPRVEIASGTLMAGCRATHKGWKTVVWIEIEAYVAKPNRLTVRVKKARAGSLPIPLKDILDRLSAAASDANLRIEWRQEEGDPVAVIDLSLLRLKNGERLELQQLEIRDHEIYLAGVTRGKDEANREEESGSGEQQ